MTTVIIVCNALLLLAGLAPIFPAQAGRIIYLSRFNKKCYKHGLPLPTDPQWAEAYNDKDKFNYILYTFEVWKRTKFWHLWNRNRPITFLSPFDEMFFEETYGYLVHKNVKKRAKALRLKALENSPDSLSNVPRWLVN